jgi:hypothetical protein
MRSSIGQCIEPLADACYDVPTLTGWKTLMRKILLLTFLIAGIAHADEYSPKQPGLPEGGGRDTFDIFGKKILPVPNESAFNFPKLETLNQWAPIYFPQAAKTNKYAIDVSSINIDDNGIVRYVVAVSSKTGNAKNIIFEGIDCQTSQYRTYGWGNADNTWSINKTSVWKVFTKNTFNSWQASLAKDFCQLSVPWSIETIRSNFKVDSAN